jgi:hypothetical protein
LILPSISTEKIKNVLSHQMPRNRRIGDETETRFGDLGANEQAKTDLAE